MKKISIITLNFNGKENTLQLLGSLREAEKSGFDAEIIVVDNGSADNSYDEIKKFYPEVKVVRSEKNLGFSGGNNLGIRHALDGGASYVFLLNNDTTIDKYCLKILFDELEKSVDVGIAAPKIYFANTANIIWYAGGIVDWENAICKHRGVDERDEGKYDTISQTDFASGCAMMVKRELFDKIGMFDDKYFLYFEDSDFSMRVKRAGWKILYVPSAIVWHVNASASGGTGSDLQEYYVTRNRLLFGFKYFPIRTKIALFRDSIKTFFNFPTRRKAVIDYYLGKLGKGSYL